MRTAFIIALLCASTYALQAQSIDRSVVGAAGLSASTTALEAHWTVGEVMILSLGTPSQMLTQGYQQGSISVSLVSSASAAPSFEMEVFPNPVHEQLTIRWDQLATDLRFRLVDLNGNTVKEATGNANRELQLLVGDLSAGMYLLAVDKGQVQNMYTWRIEILHR